VEPVVPEPVAVNPNETDQGRAVSVSEAWETVRAKLGDDGEAEPAEATPEKSAPPKAAAKPDPEPEPANGERDYVKGLAALRRKFERKESELNTSVAAREEQIQAVVKRYQPLHRAAQAIESGDFDAIAEALAEFIGDDQIKDWNALQGAALQARNNPAIREVRKLRQETERERARVAEMQKTQQNEQRTAAQRREEAQWIESVSDDLTTDADPGLAALVEITPGISQSIFAVQRDHHKATGEVLPASEAAAVALKDLYAYHQKWTKYFAENADSAFVRKISGSQTAAKSASGSASQNGARKGNGQFKRPPPNVSQNRTSEASAPARLSDAELRKRFARQMEDAAKQDPAFGNRSH